MQVFAAMASFLEKKKEIVVKYSVHLSITNGVFILMHLRADTAFCKEAAEM